MAPSLLKLSAAALAYTSGVSALQSYVLSESYNHTNFFDKFSFFESKYGTGNYNDVDPTSGYVNYRSKSDAQKLGLIATQGTEMYIGVDHATVNSPSGKGRNSVRIESKAQYNGGLFIAKFTHLPKPVCGAWPAFWMYGPDWPRYGEIDIYENWNNAKENSIALHSGAASEVGSCGLDSRDFTSPVITKNCDNHAPGQSTNQGCAVKETKGQWGSSSGGVYATEWSDDGISIWSWSNTGAPSDLEKNPNPAGWGKPHFKLSKNNCNIKEAFANHKIVLNIDFCGVAADPYFWSQCVPSTRSPTCQGFVASKPSAFNDVYWKVSYINVFQRQTIQTTTTTTTTSSTTTSSTEVDVPTSTYEATSEIPTSTYEATSEVPTSTYEATSEEPSSYPTEFPTSDVSSTEASYATSIDSPPTDTTSYPTQFPTENPSDYPGTSETAYSTEVATEPSVYPTDYPVSSDVSSSSEASYSTDVSSDATAHPTEYPASSGTSYPTEAISSTDALSSSDAYPSETVSSDTSAYSTEYPASSSVYPTETCSEESAYPTEYPASSSAVSSSDAYSTAVSSGASVYPTEYPASSETAYPTETSESAPETEQPTGYPGSSSPVAYPTESCTSEDSDYPTETSEASYPTEYPASSSSADSYPTDVSTPCDESASSTEAASSESPYPTEAQPTDTYEALPTGWTTSTVYTTTTYTITSCKPEVTDCPGKIGQVTTEVIPAYTTICPVGEEEATTTTLTTVQRTTTKTITPSTYVAETPSSVVVVEHTATVVPQPIPTYGGSGYNSSAVTSYGGCSGADCGASTVSTASPQGTQYPEGECTGEGCPVVISGGVKAGASFGLAGLVAVLAVAL